MIILGMMDDHPEVDGKASKVEWCMTIKEMMDDHPGVVG